MDTWALGKALIIAGVAIAALGAALLLLDKLPGPGRLPGDIVIRRDGFTLFLPLATMLLASVALTVLLNILLRLFK